MSVQLNHTIVHASDRDTMATHLTDPFHRREGQINHNDGGRGVYWESPDGHNLEIITVPYGG